MMDVETTAAAQFASLDALLERDYIATGRLAGAQLIIQHRGRRHERCFGHRDRERTRPLTPDTLFRIFSMTKPITSVAFMMLVEAGKVALEDPVTRYLPAWSTLTVRGEPLGRAMRIVDLLTHTSGLTYGIQYRTEVDAQYRKALSMHPTGQPLDQFTAALAGLPLEFSPGTAWNYSVGTDVIGHLIELLADESLRDYLRSRVFRPLGMQNTDFSVTPAQLPRLAECYVRRENELLGVPGPSFETGRTATPTFLSGGGGLLSSGSDYLKFCNLILDQGLRGEVRLLQPDTFRRMSTNQLSGNRDLPAVAQGLFGNADYAGIGFGLGWATTVDAHRAQLRGNPGDAFWSGMANTSFWCDPSEELIGIFMTQVLPADVYPLQRQIRALTYDAIAGAS